MAMNTGFLDQKKKEVELQLAGYYPELFTAICAALEEVAEAYYSHGLDDGIAGTTAMLE
ncbi:MAG: hypothetical protein NTY81_02675 [Candidatus Staskawiczbacteria bacterium]|nr:hypothetical protein [Candidatus Staskawiczbacteria bacterium]